jgi:WD40 repeat protein
VPALPAGYVVRAELDELVGAVADPGGSGAVGLTAAPAGLGLHGIGGIGKSVLAAAVAADGRVRRRFPDGVCWVAVGEQPDLLALQLDLLGRLGAPREARTTGEATAALRAVLADRRVLLVVDDVWSDAAARAFHVTGPRGRVLYTSRDPGVVAAAGALARRVDVLSPAGARALAGRVLGVAPAGLPPAADRALAQVGHVPLAVALLAAAVRRGSAWERVAADLARDADVYGTHPYADTFRALHVAVTALPADLRTALLGLAVLPPDTAVPVAVVARYWAHTRGRTADGTAADLDRLDAAHVLRRDGDTVGFHDLAHDYLLLHADDLPALHVQLLSAHGALLGEPGQWWRLPPDQPYLRAHLAAHLAGAGDRLVLARTVTDPAYQARRIAHDGPHAGEADLAVAARLLPDHPVVAWWRSWLPRHAHLLGGTDDEPAARVARIAATLRAWLDADPTRPPGVRPGRLTPLLPHPYPAVRGLHAPATALTRVLVDPTDGIRAVSWSPDGTRIATAGSNGAVRVWSVVAGRTTADLAGQPATVWTVAWSPDGTRIATGDHGGRVVVWDPDTGRATATLAVPAGPACAVAWSPDGGRLAVGGGDGAAGVWDPDTGAHTGVDAGHLGRVRALAWSPDGTRLASAGDDRTIRLRSVADGRRTVVPTGLAGPVWALAWSPDGARLAAGGDDAEIGLWDADTGRPAGRLTGHAGWIRALAWSPDGARLASGGDDREIRIWQPAAGTVAAGLTGHVGWVYALAWSPDGTQLASGHDDGEVRLWDPDRPPPRAPAEGHTDWVRAVAWSPDGRALATGGDDGEVRLWSGDLDRVARTLRGHADWVRAVAWSPDGRLLATGGDDRTVRVWDVATGRVIDAYDHAHRVATAAFSPDGGRLATEGLDVHLWDTGARGVRLTLGRGAVHRGVAWSPDGARLATGGSGVRLWDPATGHVADTLVEREHCRAVAWSPDGDRLAAAAGRTVVLWDPGTGREAGRLSGHADPVTALAWSPDGTTLASADAAGTVAVWDRDGRRRCAVTLEHVTCLAWSTTALAAGQWGRPALLTLCDPADPGQG